MNSLRARLIVGFSLVAVLPLSLALLLLGQRIRQTMRQQAAVRLESAMGVAASELSADGARLAARLALLARDAQLKRLFLVEPEGTAELRQFLDNQRFLLGLDYLAVTDTLGRVLADASLALPAGGHAPAEAIEAESLPAAPDSGLGLLALPRAAALVLDGRAPIPYVGARVGLVRGGVRVDSTFLARLQKLSGLELLLRDEQGRVLATTLHGGLVPRSRASDTTVAQVALGGRTYLTREADLRVGAPRDRSPSRLTALASTAPADDAIAVLTSTAAVLGLLGVLLAVVLGIVWSHQVASPVVRLAGFSERVSRGDWDEPLAMESMRELQTLVDALERMRNDLRNYREHLRASERQAAYGQMARTVAHEIKNPLTPIALSVQGLKRAYDQGHPDFAATLDDAVRTVGEEVQRLKQLLQEFNDLGRFPPPRPIPFVAGDLLSDLRTLFHHEVVAGRIAFDTPGVVLPLVADRDQIRQALLNLIQNALDVTAAAPASGGQPGHVRVAVATVGERAASRTGGESLWFAVSDDGPGLTEEERAQLFVPGFTTKAHGGGLGLTIVERIISDHRGTIEVDSAPGRGTTFIIQLPAKPEA